jgi:predicted Zn-dependent peptidase
MFSLETLDNGLRLVTARSSGTEAASVFVYVKVGSRYESRELSGAAHFIEHMMFKGTKRHPKAVDLSRTLEQYGADYNAFTTTGATGYYVKIAGSKLDVGIDLLHDMIAHSKFSPAEMKRERGVIVEEISMYEDNPRMHIGDLLNEAVYGTTPLGRDIGGTPKTVRGMSRADVLQFRDSYYVPERMVVVLAGAVSDAHIAFAKKQFGSLRARKSGSDFVAAPVFAPRAKPSVKFQEKKTEQVQVKIAFPGFPIGSPDNQALSCMTSILGSGMGSRLFIAVRERKGLAYSVGCSSRAMEDTGYVTIGAGVAKKNYVKACETIMREIERLKRGGVTEKELAEVKTSMEGGILLSLEDSSSRADWYASQILMKGEAHTPEEKLKLINAVTREDVKRIARTVFDTSRMSVAAIGPFANEDEILKPFISFL